VREKCHNTKIVSKISFPQREIDKGFHLDRFLKMIKKYLVDDRRAKKMSAVAEPMFFSGSWEGPAKTTVAYHAHAGAPCQRCFGCEFSQDSRKANY
jgi:hypothetical protein